MHRRFQGDTQWQRDWHRAATLYAEAQEHVVAGCLLRDAGCPDEAAEELQLAEEDQELADLLLEQLSSIDYFGG